MGKKPEYKPHAYVQFNSRYLGKNKVGFNYGRAINPKKAFLLKWLLKHYFEK